MARDDSRRMVFTMRGCAWPSAFTAMPPRKSRYFLPVESKTYAPRPCVNTIGERLYVGNRNCSASLSAGHGRTGFSADRLRDVLETDAATRVVLSLRIMRPNGRRNERNEPSEHQQRSAPRDLHLRGVPP